MKFLLGVFLLLAMDLSAQTEVSFKAEAIFSNLNNFPLASFPSKGFDQNVKLPTLLDSTNDYWGDVTNGFQLSIGFKKKIFTKGEPIMASILLRNVTNFHLRYIATAPKDTFLEIIVSLNGVRLDRIDEARPGMTFAEKLKFINKGQSVWNLVSPQCQHEFVADLTNRFDFREAGEYRAYAKQSIATIAGSRLLNPAEERAALANHISLETNIVSGVATFYVTNSSQ